MGPKSNKRPEPEEESEEEEEEEEVSDEGSEMEEEEEGDDDEMEDLDDDDSEYDEEEHEMEKAALLSKSHAVTPLINNHAGLRQKLSDIILNGGKKIPWVENFAVIARTTAESLVEDVDDDLKRELAFYDIALAGVRDCQEMCRSSGTPYQRPPDYYAEMVKTDDHMLKVKKELMSQAAKIEAAEIRRRQREAKKFGKAMQTERNLEKAKNKREDLNQIEKWRKGKDGKANPEKEEALLEASLSKNSTGPKKRLNDFIEEKTGRRPDEDDRGPRKSHKRLLADKKWGRGGKAKTLSKRNTFESSHDMSSFSAKKNNAQMPGMTTKPGSGIGKSKGGKGGKGGKQQRGGKERRAKQHSRRK